MDIKLKSNKFNHFIGILISFFLLSVIAVCAIATYPYLAENGNRLNEKAVEENKKVLAQNEDSYIEEFIERIYKGNYSLAMSLSMNAVSERYGDIKNPSDVFLADYFSYQYSEYDYSLYNAEEFKNNFNFLLEDWSNGFYSRTLNMYDLEYSIIDNKTGYEITNSADSLQDLADEKRAEEVKGDYTFLTAFRFDADGNLTISYLYGLPEETKRDIKSMVINKEIFRVGMFDDNWSLYLNLIHNPTNVTIVYATRMQDFYYQGITYGDASKWLSLWAFEQAGFIYVFLLAIAFAALLGILLPFKKSWNLGGGLVLKIPLELCLIGLSIPFIFYQLTLETAKETVDRVFITSSVYSAFPSWALIVLDYGINYCLWMLLFIAVYVSVLSVRQVFTLGLKRYMKEKVGIVRIVKVCYSRLKKEYHSLKEIDLTDISNKTILKIVGLNFIILTLFCGIWFLGILFLIPYSITLFVLIKRYMDDIKKKYEVLLHATSKMGKGNLDIAIEDNLGILEPLKMELTKVQNGFKKAVEEEMKSEKMKAELITNVSHDLKTPLTGIITYINLLKEENITEEDRLSYINTLDMKSKRLKSLIEDLFEVSKASSNTITLNIVELDLLSLIKQVQLELDDKITKSGIEFRLNAPSDKIILKLDSEKTYRIFENLCINITKYAMPHTRAYIDVELMDDKVIISIKNISANELNLTPEEIGERFVRGDKSRNTEGSGLGLAIVRSFVELQGGKFEIVIDGDLFKAIIIWDMK